MGELTWGRPQPLDPAGPQSPYAHWWLEHVEAGSDVRFLCVGPGRDAPARVLPCRRRRPVYADGASPKPRSGGDRQAADAMDWLEPVLGHEGRLIPFILPRQVVNAAPAPGPAWRDDELDPPAPGSVVMGVIDDGIAFANERFGRPRATEAGGAGTRVEYVWLQGAAQDPAPRDLLFGREFGRHRIEGLLRAFERAGGIDEEALYRAAGLTAFGNGEIQSGAYRASHGTAVLDKAAGCDPADPDTAAFRDAVTLMAVSLPSRITHDTSGTFLDLFVVLAIERILQRVEALRRKASAAAGQGVDYPVVINLSYALTAGPKDGRGMVDRYIDSVRAARLDNGRPPLEFFVPAGNHRLSRTHAVLCADGRPSEPLTWRILPDDRTPSFVEIWFDRDEAQGPARCRVAPPGAAAPLPPAIGFGCYADLARDGRPVARCYHSHHPPHPAFGARRGRQRIVVATHPTLPDRPGGTTSPPGDWTLALHPAAGETLRADLCVQRDDTPFGYRNRGRQSYFDDPRYEDFDATGRLIAGDDGASPITRSGTMNAYTCGWQAYVIGAACRLGGWPPPGSGGIWRGAAEALYSGKGPTPRRLDADQLRPSDETRVHRGVRTAGTYSGSTVVMSGTSLAAPAAARAFAESLLAGRPAPRRAEAARPQPAARVMT
jgi:hypothetical protein